MCSGCDVSEVDVSVVDMMRVAVVCVYVCVCVCVCGRWM